MGQKSLTKLVPLQDLVLCHMQCKYSTIGGNLGLSYSTLTAVKDQALFLSSFHELE